MQVWKLEDAQARLGEVMRKARSNGPQLITEDGQDAVMIIAAAEFAKMARPKQLFVDFMASLDFGDVDLVREPDTGRDVLLYDEAEFLADQASPQVDQLEPDTLPALSGSRMDRRQDDLNAELDDISKPDERS